MIITRKGSRKKMRHLVGSFKDHLSLLKHSLSLPNRKSALRVSILRATSHRRSSETYADALLSSDDTENTTTVVSHGHGHVANIEAVVTNRLRKTRNAYVALKCLVILHRIVLTHGTLFAANTSRSGGSRVFPNLSDFHDDGSDADTASEISKWVRWYAHVIEQYLVTRRDLDQTVMISAGQNNNERATSRLVKELESLVTFVEHVSASPGSYYLQKYDVVHEVVRSTGENYAMVQREISVRVKEMVNRVNGFSDEELTQSMNVLARLEGCEERLVKLFLTRRRNRDLWDLIGTSKGKVVAMRKRKNEGRLMLLAGWT